MADFILDPRLAADTVPVLDLPLSRVGLLDDARFPWLVLVPRRAGLVELLDLEEADHLALTAEIRQASRVLKQVFAPYKLNVAALGNAVRQLHVHVIARSQGDAAWPGPVWGVGEAVPYASAQRDELVARLRQAFSA